jgi:hypothetical protein
VNWWQLFLFISLVWCLWSATLKARIDVENTIDPLPFGPRGETSCAMVPFLAIVLCSAAKLVDLIVGPWGTNVAIAIHVVLAVIFIYGIVRQWVRLKRVEHGSAGIKSNGNIGEK